MPVLPFSLACRCAMIRAVKWMDEVEEEKRQTSRSRGKKMDKEQYRAAKARLVAQMQAGRFWQAAAATAGMQISQSTAYRLLQVVRIRGEAALQDGRHGHPSKLHGEARTFLEASCREAPQTPSSVLQALLHERFALRVSVSQINRVRAALGVSNHPKSQEQGKKRE